MAIYARQSVDTAKDFSSCEAQFQTCLDCARAFGDRDGDWIGERFHDQGRSGISVERPALKRLRQAVREGRFLWHIIASFAEFERALIAARLSDATKSLKAHSRRLAGPPPYGHGADSKTKQLVPNAREARRLQAIFEMAASGVRPSEIAHRVNKSFAQDRVSGCVRTRSVTALPAISLRSPAWPQRHGASAAAARSGVESSWGSFSRSTSFEVDRLVYRRARRSPTWRAVAGVARSRVCVESRRI